MKLPTAVYTAHTGYAWSNVPQGVSAADLDVFMRMISVARGDFPDPMNVATGIVSSRHVTAGFTIQNVPDWDANGRAADYAAFVFFPTVVARLIDFVELVNTDFFWTPTRTPTAYVDYTGPEAAPVPEGFIDRLLRNSDHCTLADPRAIGSILTAYGMQRPGWTCLMQPDGTLDITSGK